MIAVSHHGDGGYEGGGLVHTLEQIAELAGVSRSTVSRVVNNQPNVDEATRARVWQVIREHDFHPNSAARALASRRSQIIGLIIPQALSAVFADPYFPTLIQGISAACDARGYYLMLSFVTQGAGDAFRRIIRGGHLAGLVVASALVEDEFVARLDAVNFPYVLIGRSPRPAILSVDTDNVHGATIAVQHLVGLGYTRLATITGPLGMTAAVDRRDGFITAVHAAGLDLPDACVQEGDWSEASGHGAMLALLQLAERPQAVFVASDAMAVGALKAIRAAGLRVPDDIALVGFDDVPLASVVEPPLTTVRQPIERLGYLATTLLLDRLNTDEGGTSAAEPLHVVLPTELVIRASCGQAHRLARAGGALPLDQPVEGGTAHT